MRGFRNSLFRVLALLALVASAGLLAVPNLDGCIRPGATEGAVIGRLRDLAKTEQTGAQAVTRDQDQDGVGEYLGLRDLLATNRLSPLLHALHAPGIVEFMDYRMQVWLPCVDGGFTLGEDPEAPVDVARAEREWRAYAWPVVRQEAVGCAHGSRCSRVRPRPATLRTFFVDQTGVIRATRSETRQYQGDHAPSFDAAEPVPGSSRCRDGEEWSPVR